MAANSLCPWSIVIIIFGGFCANFSFEFWHRGAGILRGGGWCFWCGNLSCRSLEIAAWRTALNYHLSCPKPHIFSYFMRTRRLCILCSLAVFCLAFLVLHTFCNMNFSWELSLDTPKQYKRTPDHMIEELLSFYHLDLKKKLAWSIKHTSEPLGRDRASEIPTVRILNTFHLGSISSSVWLSLRSLNWSWRKGWNRKFFLDQSQNL